MLLYSRSGRQLPSIHARLSTLVFTAVAIALMTAAVLSIWREANFFLETKQENLSATASVFGAAVSDATALQDADRIRQSLRGITRIPGILYASVAATDGKQIAAIGTAVRLVRDLETDGKSAGARVWLLLTAQTVATTTPVINAGRQVGSITIVSEVSFLNSVAALLGLAFSGSAIALFPAFMLTRRLQKSIARPLEKLAAAMDRVTETGEYAPVNVDARDRETARLEISFNSMVGAISRATQEILDRESEIIARLSRAGELRDDQTGQHVVRVAKVSRIVAQTLGLDPIYVDDICRASPMHDVGKIAVPDAILHKPGRLDQNERWEMEKHAERGYQILSGSDSRLIQLAAELSLTHHERWDGKGYPNNLSGEAIPLSGRLTAVADVCDALFSERPYKQPWTPEQVRQHFVENSGTQFDPRCVDALLSSWHEVLEVYGGNIPPDQTGFRKGIAYRA
jgi:putative two-component system response regulator